MIQGAPETVSNLLKTIAVILYRVYQKQFLTWPRQTSRFGCWLETNRKRLSTLVDQCFITVYQLFVDYDVF